MQGRHTRGRSAVAKRTADRACRPIAVSGSAALAGALLARKFGHGAKTDGFFAAYAVYLAIVLVASALRVVVLPAFARARDDGELGREVGSWSLALAVPLVPTVAVVIIAPHWVAGLLTAVARPAASAAELLPWLDPGRRRPGLRRNRRERARGARRLRHRRARLRRRERIAGLVAIVALVGHGVAGVRLGARAERGGRGRDPARRGRSRGALRAVRAARLGHRLRMLAEGVSLPFALQGLYVIGYRFASGLGSGQPDDVLLRLPDRLAPRRRDGDLDRARLVGAARARRADAGRGRRGTSSPPRGSRSRSSRQRPGCSRSPARRSAKLVLGSSYGGGTGTELGRLVAYLAPWMIVLDRALGRLPAAVRPRPRTVAAAARGRGARSPGARRMGRPRRGSGSRESRREWR